MRILKITLDDQIEVRVRRLDPEEGIVRVARVVYRATEEGLELVERRAVRTVRDGPAEGNPGSTSPRLEKHVKGELSDAADRTLAAEQETLRELKRRRETKEQIVDALHDAAEQAEAAHREAQGALTDTDAQIEAMESQSDDDADARGRLDVLNKLRPEVERKVQQAGEVADAARREHGEEVEAMAALDDAIESQGRLVDKRKETAGRLRKEAREAAAKAAP